MPNKKLIYGFHAVEAMLRRRVESIEEILFQKGRVDERAQKVLELLKISTTSYQYVEKSILDKMTQHSSHQGIVARIQESETTSLNEKDLKKIIDACDHPPVLLILDHIQDPHNLGACLRTADAAGVTAVIVPKDRSAEITATVRKIASGAAETVPVIPVTNLARCMRQLKEWGVWLIGTSDKAEKTIYEMDLKGPIAWIMGNEETGLGRLVREECDFLARIPMSGTVSSLNVSVATAVCLFETVRQRLLKHQNLP